MKALVRATVPVVYLCLSGFLYGQSKPSASLLVLSKQEHSLSVVDPSSLRVLARVPVGNDPHEVIASEDGTTAYVSNYGFGAYNTLTIVDLVTDKKLRTVDLGPLRGPHGLAFEGGKTWFTAEAAKAIGRYDPATGKVDWILGTGQNRTHMIYVSKDGQRIVTSNVNSGTVSIIDQEPVRMPGPPPGAHRPGGMPPPPGGPGGAARTDWNETVVRVGNGSEGFDVSPDGKEIWVANAQDGTLSVINFHEKKVVDTLAINAQGANRLKFTLDGKRVLVSSGPELIVLDASTRKVVKRILIGHGSGGVLVEADGARAFVACGPDNYVAVIDLKTLAVTGHIQAGGEPDGMAWAVRR
ncbi:MULTISPECIES: YncE family protein [Acidobacteriaceae]|uniref:YVTN family beta-propeller repeat protein n=1 Tax=Acidobacteriaceae TaxID=204434 RepID=UPI00131EC03C|nr:MULTISPECIES: YncE family protein [Acidobacteriaceae]MDW5267769.1 YncE family protein [Edaphobacter sp.]